MVYNICIIPFWEVILFTMTLTTFATDMDYVWQLHAATYIFVLLKAYKSDAISGQSVKPPLQHHFSTRETLPALLPQLPFPLTQCNTISFSPSFFISSNLHPVATIPLLMNQPFSLGTFSPQPHRACLPSPYFLLFLFLSLLFSLSLSLCFLFIFPLHPPSWIWQWLHVLGLLSLRAPLWHTNFLPLLPPTFFTLHYTYWLTSHSPWTNHSPHHALYNCVPRCSYHYSWTAWLSKIKLTGCPETSVTRYQSYQSMLVTSQKSEDIIKVRNKYKDPSKTQPVLWTLL